jgi:hypothetical protein
VKKFFYVHDRKALSNLSRRILVPDVVNLCAIIEIYRNHLIGEVMDLFFERKCGAHLLVKLILFRKVISMNILLSEN